MSKWILKSEVILEDDKYCFGCPKYHIQTNFEGGTYPDEWCEQENIWPKNGERIDCICPLEKVEE